MKKHLLLTLLVPGFLIASNSWALPTLQLDIVGGTYVGGSEESTITNDPLFTLQAFGQGVNTGPANPYYLSAAVLNGHDSVSDGTDFGSFSINGTTYSQSNGNVVFEIPPSEVFDPDLASVNDPDLQKHSIFPTIFTELKFNFVAGQTTAAYNVQDDSSSPGVMNYVDFAVDVNGLLAGFNLHFDLYTYEAGNKKVTEFAPFSHDAGTTTNVPEPSLWSLFLMGSLMIAGVSYRRRI